MSENIEIAAQSPASIDSLIEVEKLKKVANEYFAQKKYKEAEDTYTLALSNESPEELRSVLLANRSAARMGLSMFELALSDAEEAIRLNPSWVKSYYRKSSALEAMGKYRQAIETWRDASYHCSTNPADLTAIEKQLAQLKKKWTLIFYLDKHPIESDVDLLSRYSCLFDKRERLSTLAHFWNDSTPDERFSYFQLLIRIIGGETGLSDATLEHVTAEVMIPMPLHNYPDLPRERIQLWCDYFRDLDVERKRLIFEAIWNKILLSEEKNDVILDLKLLFSQSIQSSDEAPNKDFADIDEEEYFGGNREK